MTQVTPDFDHVPATKRYFKDGMDWYVANFQKPSKALALIDRGNGKVEIDIISVTDLIQNGVRPDREFTAKTFGKLKQHLRSMGRLAVGVSVAVSLVACAASPEWVKPNASPSEYIQTRSACEQEAVQLVPPKITEEFVAGESFNSESCDKKGRNCSTYNTFTPPHIEKVDQNAPARENAAAVCMGRNGWLLKP